MNATPVKKCCGTCRWAHGWRLTMNKPPRKRGVAVCTWTTPEILVPTALSDAMGYIPINDIRKQSVFTTYGTDCPVWEQEKGNK